LSLLTTDQKGALVEQAVAVEALKHGLGVLWPFGDERYDVVLDLRPRLLRGSVQMGSPVR
jgi:PD-(D/E)XK endonuclease